jgi:N4-(beta-N-acetylglucosaminyl)-L-asparaginase
MSKISRRHFIEGMGLAAASLFSGTTAEAESVRASSRSQTSAATGGLVAVASGNGLRATEKAMELLRQGSDPLDAVISGVNIIEEDPEDTSVGYGGLPNEEGVVELDASVMHGPTHNAGAVASLRNIKTPSKVAKLVMERSDHALLVGEGALNFARAHGFAEENLLTERARKIWLRWKESLSDRDNWFPPKQDKLAAEIRPYLESYGTINCLARNDRGDLAGVTTTSGLAFKLPGRVGDSPVIGAGLYVDNDIGAAGSTGRGEANILNCGSFLVVDFMGHGASPEEACLRALEKIAGKTKLQPHLLNPDGAPRFGLEFYAISKKGEFGSASMWSGSRFAVHDGKENKHREAAYLFKRKR